LEHRLKKIEATYEQINSVKELLFPASGTPFDGPLGGVYADPVDYLSRHRLKAEATFNAAGPSRSQLGV